MTLNDLREEVSVLGFEREIDTDAALVTSIRRALSTIYTERAVYNSISIEHYPIMPTIICKSLVHNPKENETFAINGPAYSFTVSGKGGYRISDNGVETEHYFDTASALQRGFCSVRTTVAFFGSLSFKVFNLAVFEEKEFDDENKLFAYGEPFEYKLSNLKNDFHSFTALPTDERGNEIKGAELSGDGLFIPWEYRGRVNLTYKSAPPKVSADDADSELSIPVEIEHLVPLLAASYYWLDDSPDKAEYYYTVYRDSMASVKRQDTRRLGGGYKNVTGWA